MVPVPLLLSVEVTRFTPRLPRPLPAPAVPRILGGLLWLAAAGYLTDSFAKILLPTYDEHASALLMAAAFALAFRRYLFGPLEPGPEDFPWLAATLIPGAALMTLAALAGKMVDGEVSALAGAPGWTLVGSFLVVVADSLALAAGLTIAVAALCYSKGWSGALKRLLVQFVTFKIIVWVRWCRSSSACTAFAFRPGSARSWISLATRC